MSSNNVVDKQIEKITETDKSSYVIIEENFDPKNSVISKIKNEGDYIKQNMLEEKVNITDVK